MDSTFPIVFGRSFGWIVRLTLMVGVCSLVFFTMVPTAQGVSADSPIFGNTSTPTGSSVITSSGKKVGVSRGSDSVSTEPLPLPEETPQPLPGFFSTFSRLIFALGITLGLIYLTVWGLKFLWEKRGLTRLQDESKPIKVLASAYLAPRKTLHLVEVGKRILVIASGNEEVHPLDVIQDESEVEALKKACHQGFPDVIGKLIKKQDIHEHKIEAQKIVSEGRQVVGDYLSKVQSVSKSMKKKSDEDVT